MDVWSEEMSAPGRRSVVFKSIIERSWLARLVSRRNPSEGALVDGATEQGEWNRRIRLLSEECDALRRKMQPSA